MSNSCVRIWCKEILKLKASLGLDSLSATLAFIELFCHAQVRAQPYTFPAQNHTIESFFPLSLYNPNMRHIQTWSVLASQWEERVFATFSSVLCITNQFICSNICCHREIQIHCIQNKKKKITNLGWGMFLCVCSFERLTEVHDRSASIESFFLGQNEFIWCLIKNENTVSEMVLNT